MLSHVGVPSCVTYSHPGTEHCNGVGGAIIEDKSVVYYAKLEFTFS